MRRLSDFVAGFVLCLILASSARADWYDGNWNFRRQINVTNFGLSALTAYAVPLTLDPGHFDFAHALPDGSDLRFTDTDGSTALSFWIEDFDAGIGWAKVWVRVPSLSAGSSHPIYVYYGNPSATSQSNGNGTFPSFAGFEQNFEVLQRASTPNLQRMADAPETPAPIIPLGAVGEFDHWGMREHGNVLYEPGEANPSRRYKTWYSAIGDSVYITDRDSWMGQAVSPDGYNWTKMGMVSTTIHGEDPYAVHVGNTYYLYYEGKTGPQFDDVSLLTSPDGITWTFWGVVVPPNPNFNWMDRSPSSPTLWVEYGPQDTTWYLYFEAKGTGPNRGGGSIGLATSTDGYHFTVYGTTPIIELGVPGSWDSAAMVPDCIYRENGLYWLIYHGNNGWGFWAGYAYSTDLIHWTKVPEISGNPTITPVGDPQVFLDADGRLTATMCQSTGICRGYLFRRDSTQWPYSASWTLDTRGGAFGLTTSEGGVLHVSAESFQRASTNLISTQRYTNGFEIRVRERCHDYGNAVFTSIAFGSGDVVDMNQGGQGQWETTALQSGYVAWNSSHGVLGRMPAQWGVAVLGYWDTNPGLLNNYNTYRIVYDRDGYLRWYAGDTLRLAVRDTTWANNFKRVLISQGELPNGTGGIQDIDWVFVRPFANPEPTASAGDEQQLCVAQLAAPNGGEVITLGSPFEVQWSSGQGGGLARIELNRHFPSGSWEVLADSTANDGIETIVFTGDASSQCRIRVTCLNAAQSAMSDRDFVLMLPQQVLSLPGDDNLVNGCSADFPIYLVANVANMRDFRLAYRFDPAIVQFTGWQPMPNSHIAGIQSTVAGDTLDLAGGFVSNFTGVDTMVQLSFHILVQNDATSFFTYVSGRGTEGSPDSAYDITILGSGSTLHIDAEPPLSPDGIVLRPVSGPGGNDLLRLDWRPVTHDVAGDTLIAPRYSVYFEEIANPLEHFVGSTMDTTFLDTYTHGLNLPPFDRGTYIVRACKTRP